MLGGESGAMVRHARESVCGPRRLSRSGHAWLDGGGMRLRWKALENFAI